jgi:hypothetical protein
MWRIEAERNWNVEKDLFDLPVCDSMLRPVLPDVPIVPVAALPLGWIELGHKFTYIAGVY